MQRISLSIDDDLLALIDDISARRHYASRSEALRDIVREAVKREQHAQAADTPCVATLSYVYEHETRDLARRLTTVQHHRHDLSVATLHVHVSDADCLEVVVLKGHVGDVQSFADGIITQRGVRFGSLNIVPTEGMAGDQPQGHDGGHDGGHGHTRPAGPDAAGS